jgi:hypothetical protein
VSEKRELTPTERLQAAVEYVNANYPLPRCQHGSALRDHGGEMLEPPCGCRATDAAKRTNKKGTKR